MAALTTRKIEAVVHTKIDAARRRTVAKTIALDRLSAFLGDAAPALQPPALPWVDLEIRPAFREPVEICVDCPEKATESTAFKVSFAASCGAFSWSCLLDGVIGATSRRCLFDGVIGTTSRRWRELQHSQPSRRWRGILASRRWRLGPHRRPDVAGAAPPPRERTERLNRSKAPSTGPPRLDTKQSNKNTGPGPARARGGLARGAKSQTKLLRPRPRPRRGRRRGGARKSFGALRAWRHVGAARGLGRAAAPQSAEGVARLRRPAASKVLRGPEDNVRRAGVASMA